jgi:hypothetical protein
MVICAIRKKIVQGRRTGVLSELSCFVIGYMMNRVTLKKRPRNTGKGILL